MSRWRVVARMTVWITMRMAMRGMQVAVWAMRAVWVAVWVAMGVAVHAHRKCEARCSV